LLDVSDDATPNTRSTRMITEMQEDDITPKGDARQVAEFFGSLRPYLASPLYQGASPPLHHAIQALL
jgi:hypothetical protein